MSFFIRGKHSVDPKKSSKPLKRKRIVKKSKKEADLEDQIATKKSKDDDDEEISSETDEDLPVQNGAAKEAEPDEEESETAQEKRLRLANKIIEGLTRKEQDKAGSTDIDREAIGKRIKDDLLEQAGKLRKNIADLYVGYNEEGIKKLRCKEHNSAITALSLSQDGNFLYSASKDCSIVKWSLTDFTKVKSIPGGRKGTENRHKGHTTTVNCIAVSSDNKFLASGDDRGQILIWDAEIFDLLKTFKHQSAVTGVVFRKGTHQLYSSSKDRSVKIWSLDEMTYIESLFGHQATVTSIDALSRERAITSGGRDNSLRIWKIVEESQLIYNGHKGSIDCVKLINEEYFLSCGDDGTLCLWGSMKKKPIAVIENAHGFNSENDQPYWVSSIAACLNTDLVASGSMDGNLKLWKCGEGFKNLTPLMSIPVVGFINAIAFTPDGSHVIVGLGQEHRLGRWWRMKEARNCIFVIPLVKNSTVIKD
ncbi:Hypothetical predicted protein [Cloeon dipterum]|uniref:U3 small nucleolar RNA-interacting protein 2 n=1 Tax=Cloeon dipterum TaxID=197152 RepID=A0A8S1CIH9_9INSE|nr:Hypothetical predicted protein [Cloeon dipterum]